MPADARGGAREQVFKEADEVLLGAALANRAQNLPGGDVEAGDDGLGTVATVLELLPLHMTRLDW